MKLTQDRGSKALWIGAKGSTSAECITVGQVERLRVEFLSETSGQPAKLADGYTLTVGLKKRGGTVLLASCSTWTVDGQTHIGTLDLRTDPCMALVAGDVVDLELQWDDLDFPEISDAHQQELTIKRPLFDSEDELPDSGSLAAFAAFLAERVVAEDETIVITPDATNGRILVRSEGGGGGSSITYSGGFARTTISGTQYKWPVSQVA